MIGIRIRAFQFSGNETVSDSELETRNRSREFNREDPRQRRHIAGAIVLDREEVAPFQQRIWWAKCDMIATVGFARLDLFRTDRDQTGRRKYLHPILGKPDVDRLRAGILASLGMVVPQFEI
jgi:hypothetical protein